MDPRSPIGDDDRQALAALHATIGTLLPPAYQTTYETLQPVSMGSAGLVYDAGGGVAWDRIWGSFCDLAMAGGPPHKGTWLEPGARAAIDAQPDRYNDVTWEMCRGITMVTDLRARVSQVPGWVRVECYNDAMAAWLMRAIVMENVAAVAESRWLSLPAGPDFRLEKELKNVITVIAKTCHYWIGHMLPPQQWAIGELLETMNGAAPLVAPPWSSEGGVMPDHGAAATFAARLAAREGFEATPRQAGWIGVTCPGVAAAVWMMRALIASNVLARREDTTLCVPVDDAVDPHGDRVASALVDVRRLYRAVPSSSS